MELVGSQHLAVFGAVSTFPTPTCCALPLYSFTISQAAQMITVTLLTPSQNNHNYDGQKR